MAGRSVWWPGIQTGAGRARTSRSPGYVFIGGVDDIEPRSLNAAAVLVARFQRRFKHSAVQKGSLNRIRWLVGEKHLFDVQGKITEMGVGTILSTVALRMELGGLHTAVDPGRIR